MGFLHGVCKMFLHVRFLREGHGSTDSPVAYLGRCSSGAKLRKAGGEEGRTLLNLSIRSKRWVRMDNHCDSLGHSSTARSTAPHDAEPGDPALEDDGGVE